MILLFLFLTQMSHAAPKCFTLKEVRDKACKAVCIDRRKDTGSYDATKRLCICGEYIDNGEPINIVAPTATDLSGGWFGRLIKELGSEE